MSQTEVTINEDVTIKYTTPKKYCVVVHNDDSTPMEFVIELLMVIYNHDHKSATDITMQVHEKSKAVAGIYYYEIAEQKVYESITASRNAGFPLSFTIEEK
jgi:ATP-dependent Clp protease adaptor protein ClpS